MVLECAEMVPSGVDLRSSYDGPSMEPQSGPLTPKDASKRKKVNRRAKLKQCKLDARREQWLSQQGKNKSKSIGRQQNGNSGDQGYSREEDNSQIEHGGSPMNGFSQMDSVSSKASIEEEEEVDNGECSSEEVNNKTRVPDSSQDDDDGEEDARSDVEDDWEAAADALNIEESPSRLVKEETPCIANHAPIEEKPCFSIEERVLRPEYKIKSTSFTSKPLHAGGGRAWRHDDVCRPNTLPKLSKQHSFPSQSCRPSSWGPWNSPSSSSPPPVPASCPICYEDLDVTDFSFVPCACGFRLCLFCHKRIIEQDGRCPGCRKRYAAMDVGTKVITTRLPRSCSMRLKV